jgi:cytochrome d ubiquinol oxidase subunit II
MQTAWFITLALMLTAYVVLDGFDFGAGILHVFVAKTDEERRTVLAAIGPFWDGNEVWLVASGGILVFAFPRVYAVVCSGFYLPLTMVLWLLIARGISIEFRSQEQNVLWRAFWDGAFALSSTGMAAVLGVTLGNLLRGFPLEPSGYFAMPLFTNFRAGPDCGAFDWYTLLVGGTAVLALAAHGALYLAWKTEGAVHQRSARLARWLLGSTGAAFAVAAVATHIVDPAFAARVLARPVAYPIAAVGVGGAVSLVVSAQRARHLPMFVGSCAVLGSLLLLAAVGMFPTLLRSNLAAADDLTTLNASSGQRGLVAGFWWWTPAMMLAVAYFVLLFRMFRGKVSARDYGH